ncbi:MAG: hypothetical protein H0W79_04755 [Rubrobacteraceae bacterium]|nr:hypothetical protein [Rubrobacteraceae bacterium]
MSVSAASRLAWSLWAISVILTALSLLLLVLNLSHPDVHVYDYWLENTLSAVLFSTVGAIVASRRSENPVGWLLCLLGVAFSIGHSSSQYAIYTLLARPNSLPAGQALAWISSWILPPIIGLQVFSFLLFPTGRLPSRRWIWLACLTVAFVVAGVISSAFSFGANAGLGPVQNPLGIEGFLDVYDAVLLVSSLLYVAVAYSLFVRLRRAGGVERQQIKWFAYAVVATVGGTTIAYSIPDTINTPLWFEWAGYALLIATTPAIPISIGIAILRYRLYDIDRIINRTLVYGALTITLVALYFGGIVVLQRVFVILTGQKSTLAVVASTLLIAALFTPLRRRIQDFIDRRFYRRKYDAAKTLEAFSLKLRDETDLEQVNADLLLVVRATMQPKHVSLWLKPAERELKR